MATVWEVFTQLTDKCQPFVSQGKCKSLEEAQQVLKRELDHGGVYASYIRRITYEVVERYQRKVIREQLELFSQPVPTTPPANS